ncbi:MAG TPA: ferredoxin [Dehalococcoidia bacterium]|jgi:ferredoxin|nr:ferredoxin [Dehalococcoidia bacterium]|tara:strand:- start:363 stop:587 length:225 start_codon:yes stop_codon:yes gene_type:complete
MPKIVHYRKKCIGCNSCVEQAPNYWKISEEDGKSNLLHSEKKRECFVLKIDQIELEANEKAARDCPVRIIKIDK